MIHLPSLYARTHHLSGAELERARGQWLLEMSKHLHELADSLNFDGRVRQVAYMLEDASELFLSEQEDAKSSAEDQQRAGASDLVSRAPPATPLLSLPRLHK